MLKKHIDSIMTLDKRLNNGLVELKCQCGSALVVGEDALKRAPFFCHDCWPMEARPMGRNFIGIKSGSIEFHTYLGNRKWAGICDCGAEVVKWDFQIASSLKNQEYLLCKTCKKAIGDASNDIANLYARGNSEIEVASLLADLQMRDVDIESVVRLARKKQTAFRKRAFARYSGKCALTNCSIAEALEASHIYEHRESGNNAIANALLLRVDIHRLFDRNLLRINPSSRCVECDSRLRDSDYWQYNGKKIPVGKCSLSEFTKYLVIRWKTSQPDKL